MNLPGVYKLFNERWSDYQTVHILSDLHFNEDDLKTAFPNRPSDEELVRRINAKVGKRDVLILLGDCGDPSFVRQLRGYKILIAGNHEPGLTAFEGIFQEIYSGPLMIGEKLILSHEPIPDIVWAMNIHGHNHNSRSKDKNHFNVCADVIGYEPINFNQWLKAGLLSKIDTLHRITIDAATKRARKRGHKLGK